MYLTQALKRAVQIRGNECDPFLYAEIDIDGTVSQGGDPISIDETTVIRAIVYDKFGQNLPSFGGPVAANSLGGFTSF